MNIKYALPFLCVTLAGCTSTADELLAQQPDLTATVTPTPTQIRDCITSKHPGKFRVTPTGEGWLVDYTIEGTGVAMFATTITPEGDHTLVKSYLFKMAAGDQAPDYYTDLVVACSKAGGPQALR